MNKMRPLFVVLVLIFGVICGFTGWAFANKDMALYWMQMAELQRELNEYRFQEYFSGEFGYIDTAYAEGIYGVYFDDTEEGRLQSVAYSLGYKQGEKDAFAEYKHIIWHYDEQAKWLHSENQRMHRELIDSELYEVDNEIVGEFGTLRSYKKVEQKPYFVIQKIPVYVEVEKEVIRWRNKPYRPWYSVEEFKEWYQEQHYESRILLGDCDDYALQLQVDAHEQGRLVSVALTWGGAYYSTKVTDAPGGHAGNLILIHGKNGDVFYFVEPQESKAKVIRVINRD